MIESYRANPLPRFYKYCPNTYASQHKVAKLPRLHAQGSSGIENVSRLFFCQDSPIKN